MNSDIRWNDAGSGEWHMRRWCTALIIICLMAGWIALWQEEKVLSVSTVFVETKKAALTFDDDVIIGLSQEISYKEAVSMI